MCRCYCEQTEDNAVLIMYFVEYMGDSAIKGIRWKTIK